jgi:hypothetical protein
MFLGQDTVCPLNPSDHVKVTTSPPGADPQQLNKLVSSAMNTPTDLSFSFSQDENHKPFSQ